MMGGQAGAESRPDHGSLFWFTALLGRGRASALQSPERLRVGARILLSEDNLINQEVARELLQAVGLVVEVACDGQEALEMARARVYDLILMDMQMPRMDGLEATPSATCRIGRASPFWP